MALLDKLGILDDVYQPQPGGAMLAAAEDVTLTPQPQVVFRQLEAVGAFLHRRQPFQGVRVLAARDQIDRPVALATANAAAQLMQLGQAEAVGIEYHHHRGVGHVYANLHYGGGYQDVYQPGAEVGHHLALLRWFQPAGHQGHAPVGEDLALQVAQLLLGGLDMLAVGFVGELGQVIDGAVIIVLFQTISFITAAGRAGSCPSPSPATSICAHARTAGRHSRRATASRGGVGYQGADDISLLAALQGLADGLIGVTHLLLVYHLGGDGAAGPRLGADIGCLHVAVDGQGQGARYRRSGHSQQVAAGALVAECLALLDTEAVLLVDDYQRQPLEADIRLYQGMGAEYDAYGPVFQAAEQLLAQRVFGGRGQKPPGNAAVIEHRPQL